MRRFTQFLLLAICIFLNNHVHAMTIRNETSQTLGYWISGDSANCIGSIYDSGILEKNQQRTWNATSTQRVCVSGFSLSRLGTYHSQTKSYDLNATSECILTAKEEHLWLNEMSLSFVQSGGCS